jgi:hypothetical protein
VSIETVFFEYGRDGRPQIYSAEGREITQEVEFATYGQMILGKGRCVEDADLIRRSGAVSSTICGISSCSVALKPGQTTALMSGWPVYGEGMETSTLTQWRGRSTGSR